MKLPCLALGSVMAVMTALAAPVAAQVVIERDHSRTVDPAEAELESQVLQDWNRRHSATGQWGERRGNFGPHDVIRLLEGRGFRVRDVNDVGARFLVKASRGDEDLLVSVSRSGEIMGIVHDRY